MAKIFNCITRNEEKNETTNRKKFCVQMKKILLEHFSIYKLEMEFFLFTFSCRVLIVMLICKKSSQKKNWDELFVYYRKA